MTIEMPPRAFLVIWGTHRPFNIDQEDTTEGNEEIRKYVDRIVYGQPSRIFGIYTGRGTFVALCEWEGDESWRLASHTMRRMPSFPHGCSLTMDVDVAFKEFGTWVCHYAGLLEYHKIEAFPLLTEYAPDAEGRDARFTRTDDGEDGYDDA